MIRTALLAFFAFSIAYASGRDPASQPRYSVPTGKVGCSKLVEDFCDALWAPDALGNLTLEAPDAPSSSITLGRTPSENIYSYALYYEARAAARPFLPAAFKARLEARGYFEKVYKVFHHKPYAKMSAQEDERIRTLIGRVDSIWSEALQNTATAQVTKKHPGFFRLTEDKIPTVISHAYGLAKDELEASINLAIWSHHPRWKLVQEEFQDIKSVFLELIRDHPSASAAVKERWIKRITEAKLFMPGADPVRLNDTERRCASTELNGFHSSDRNAITVCGGYILSGDPSRTIAHELAHTLGQYRTEFEHALELPLASRLRALRENTCRKSPYHAPVDPRKPLSCGEWKQWKTEYAQDLLASPAPPEQSEEFMACFQTKKLKGEPPASTLDYIAREWVQGELEYGARRDRFIRMTKEKETLRDGSTHPNPAYLDPCGIYYIFDGLNPYSADFTLNLFFVNEYRCQIESAKDQCKAKPERCLEAAIDGADSLEYALRRRTLAEQTRFSAIKDLQRQGYAEDIEEDLSDNLGQMAFARYLEKRKSQAERRSTFLTTLSSLCDEPSLAKLYPAEAQVQKKYYFDSHSEGLNRRRKLLIAPVREALGCEKDFEGDVQECNWYHPGSPLHNN